MTARGRNNESAAGPRVCVVGAGPSGIAAGRNMLAAGLADLTIFEKGDQVGGNWVFSDGPSHSSVYETAHAISSRKLSQYDGSPCRATIRTISPTISCAAISGPMPSISG